jgi:hypothetical protein
MKNTGTESAPISCTESMARQYILPNYWKNWAAFNRDILGHSYCERTWVAQEIVFSKEALILFGGAEASPFSWTIFEMTLLLAPWVHIILKDPLIGLGIWDSDVADSLYAPSRATVNFGVIGRYRQAKETREDFLILLVSLRSLQATDPRDKIYGLQNLARNRSVYSSPDYRKTVEHVYTTFARDTLLHNSAELGSLLAEAVSISRRSRCRAGQRTGLTVRTIAC